MATKNYTPIDHLIKKHQPPVPRSKEVEPPLPSGERPVIKEAVEHEPEPGVGSYVQSRKETIKLPPDLKKMGLQAIPTTKFPSYRTVSLPISDDKVLKGLHAPIYSSLRWLATLAMYLLAQAHLTLKTIHGRVVRVIKR